SFEGVAGVQTKAPSIGRVVLNGFRHARAMFASRAGIAFRPEGNGVKRRKPHPYPQPRCRCPYPLGDLSQKPGAILEASAIVSISSMRAQELMTEVSVAMLDIDKIESDLASHFSGVMKCFYDPADLCVLQNRIVLWNLEPRVENRMMVENAGLRASQSVGMAEASRVGQLQADDQSVYGTRCLSVFLDKLFAQHGETVTR